MARYVLAGASLLVMVVCVAVLWSSAFASDGEITVRYITPPTQMPVAPVAPVAPAPGQPAPVEHAVVGPEGVVESDDPAVGSGDWYLGERTMVLVTDAAAKAAAHAPFGHRNSIGAPRLGSQMIAPGAYLPDEHIVDRWEDTLTMLDGTSRQLAAARDFSIR